MQTARRGGVRVRASTATMPSRERGWDARGPGWRWEWDGEEEEEEGVGVDGKGPKRWGRSSNSSSWGNRSTLRVVLVWGLVAALVLGSVCVVAWSLWLSHHGLSWQPPDPADLASHVGGRQHPPQDLVFIKEGDVRPGNVLRQVKDQDKQEEMVLPGSIPVLPKLEQMVRLWARHQFHIVQPSKPKLLIGVLSARGHATARHAQRATWGSLLSAFTNRHPHPFPIELRFFVGASSCPIPPEDRADPYGCEPQPMKNPVFDREVFAHDIPRDLEGNDVKGTTGTVVGMDFRAHHPITITRLGAFDSGSDGLKTPVTVTIWDTIRQTPVVSRTITGTEGTLRGGARYVDVKGVVLTKDTTFTVTAEGYGADEPLHTRASSIARVNDAGGIIEWLPVSRTATTEHAFPDTINTLSQDRFKFAAGTFAFRSERVAPASVFSLPWKDHVSYPVIHLTSRDALKLVFEVNTSLLEVATRTQMQECNARTVVKDWTPQASRGQHVAMLSDLDEGSHFFISRDRCATGMKMEVNVSAPVDMRETLEKLRASRFERLQKYNKVLEREAKAIKQEMREHGDVVVVPHLQDTYRSLPRKLLGVYTYASAAGAQFVLKTDDDTFLNIPEIVAQLEKKEVTATSKLWWGSFRCDWPVERTGKWAESHFPGRVYPPFACGSGSVVSGDLAVWLAQSAGGLHDFQGEDVSLGIWLQAVTPTIVQDGRWQCFGADVACKEDTLLSSPEHSPTDLMKRFGEWKRCGSFCGRCEDDVGDMEKQ
ncbi:hypothetical protein PTSG_06143 [Salpingoeca rosetta]|uniref:UDP-GalNAc:beta-1,3-N-acetylgalactosaminyltransferase 2 n=1 Tax=Salpingoeca rosetta (strain ATCC 50818 / BSB-021) TaxID=946362 RepID=F2UC26_SALR5|nr:uncharacterized protein PTSG_06143 [Salpingoeca rosetta]EGD74133.1 hypothetical protein PTSG_06143 [Salpingoeca rosetta]|eukprot:XP_004993034.1 hypothetical protein PTSG_06143 [Salpingoeca rosetta]